MNSISPGFRYVALLLVFMIPLVVFAQRIPKKPSPPMAVNDLANILNQSEQNSLERKLRTYNDTTSSAIVVVTVNTTDGQDIGAYAVDLAHEWGIGRKDVDNGILLLVAAGDRRVNISTGYGAEGAVTDADARLIIENEIIPAFREGSYYRGIDQGVDAIIAQMAGEYKPKPGSRQVSTDVEGIPSSWINFFLIFLVFFIIPRLFAARARKRHLKGRRGRSPSLMTLLLLSMFGGGRGGGGGFGGGGGGGFGGGGGGGFGGFGGGGFGGGGASGSW